MRVVTVRVTPVVIQDPPLLNVIGVHQPYTPRCVIEVEFDNGIVGLGETYGDHEYHQVLLAAGQGLIGVDVYDVVGTRRVVMDAVDRRPSPLPAAAQIVAVPAERFGLVVYAAYEVAFLDAQGQLLGVPVHTLLGGRYRDEVAYAAYLFYKWAEHPVATGFDPDPYGEALDPDGVVAQAKLMVDRYGFGSLKLKGGVFRPEVEVETVIALAEAFPALPIRIDPNAGWTVPTALAAAERMAGRLEYLEDPVNGLSAMAEVAAAVPMPLATNMCVTAFSDLPAAIAQRPVGVVLADHHFWGGLRETVRLAGICRTFDLGVSMHSNTHLGISLAAMTQVAAAIPNLDYACDTHTPWQTEDVVTAPPQIVGGSVRVSDEPGLGVTLDRDRLAEMHENWLRTGVVGRDDVAAMRVVDPGWTFTLPRF